MNTDYYLKLAGAESVDFYIDHLLAMGKSAFDMGRGDIAARLTEFAADLIQTPKVAPLPCLQYTKGAGIHTYGLEDFTDITTVYVCRGLLNRKALLAIPLPSIAYCLPAISAVNEFVRDNHVERLVFCCDNDHESIADMRRLQAFVRVESKLWVAPAETVRDAITRGHKPQ